MLLGVFAALSLAAYLAIRTLAHPTMIDMVVYRAEGQAVLHGHDLLSDIPVVGSKVLRPLVSRLVGHPGYFRFESDFRLSVTRDDGRVDVRTGTTLHELVALR